MPDFHLGRQGTVLVYGEELVLRILMPDIRKGLLVLDLEPTGANCGFWALYYGLAPSLGRRNHAWTVERMKGLIHTSNWNSEVAQYVRSTFDENSAEGKALLVTLAQDTNLTHRHMLLLLHLIGNHEQMTFQLGIVGHVAQTHSYSAMLLPPVKADHNADPSLFRPVFVYSEMLELADQRVFPSENGFHALFCEKNMEEMEARGKTQPTYLKETQASGARRAENKQHKPLKSQRRTSDDSVRSRFSRLTTDSKTSTTLQQKKSGLRGMFGGRDGRG